MRAHTRARRAKPIERDATIPDIGEVEHSFRREAERHSGMNPNTVGSVAEEERR
jgi:hypothetical protein